MNCERHFAKYEEYRQCVNKKKDFIQCFKKIGTLPFPRDCRTLKTKVQDAKKKLGRCLDGRVPGSFSSCMSMIKSLQAAILSESCPTNPPPPCASPCPAPFPSPSISPCQSPSPSPSPSPCQSPCSSLCQSPCITPGTTTTPKPPPPPSPCYRTDGNEIVKETSVYNPDSKELTISVYAHSTRNSVNIIIGEISTVAVFDVDAYVFNTPSNYLDILNGAENNDGSKDVIEMIKSETELQEMFSFNLDLGDLTVDEFNKLSEPVKNILVTKRVRKSQSIKANKDLYEQTSKHAMRRTKRETTIKDSDIANILPCSPSPPPSPYCTTPKV